MVTSEKKEKIFSISMIDEGLSEKYFNGLDRLVKKMGFPMSLEKFMEIEMQYYDDYMMKKVLHAV